MLLLRFIVSFFIIIRNVLINIYNKVIQELLHYLHFLIIIQKFLVSDHNYIITLLWLKYEFLLK